jgi:hypothetical protein
VGNILEMGRDVIADINGFFAEPATKLCDVGYGRVIKGPERVLVERLNALFQADFNAVGEEIVLTQKILLLDFGVQRRIVLFSYRHN